jgi:hypothetical protein
MSRWNLISGGPSRVHLRPEHLLPNAANVVVNRAIDVVGQGIRVDFAAIADAPLGVWKPLGLERYLRLQPNMQLWVSLIETHRKVTIKRDKKLKKGIPSPAFIKSALKVFSPTVMRTLTDFAERWFYEKAESFEVVVPGPPILWFWEKELPLGIGFRVLPQGTVADVNDQSQGRVAFTLVCALERIWQFEPTHVRIISADMVGPWIEGKSEEECHAFEKERVEKEGGRLPLDRWRHERHAIEQSIARYKKKAKTEVTVEFVTPQSAPATASACPSSTRSGLPA